MNNRRYIIPSTTKSEQLYSQNSYQENQISTTKDIVFPWVNKNLQDRSTIPNQNMFPPYLRSVAGVFPADITTANACKIPFGIIISPASVSNCPVVDCRNEKLHHCNKCKSYLCPQVQILQQENAWICPICGQTNTIPPEYFMYSSISCQSKRHFTSRTEFQYSVYDIIAPKSYKNKNSEPIFCFLVDMSFPALSIGFTQQMLLSIKASLDSLNPNTHVGLMTMSNKLSIFDLVNSIEIIIPDISEINCSLNQFNLFPLIKDCKNQLIDAIDELLNRHINPNIEGHCFGSALQLCEQTMKNNGGIIIAGLVGLPKYGQFQLKPRSIVDNNELPLLQLPKDGSGKIFRDCAIKLNHRSVSVHLFSAGQQFIDLSVIGVPSGLTTGECKHYKFFDEYEQKKMHSDIFYTLTNQYYWDSYLKLHHADGCKVIRPHANCVIRNGETVLFPVISQEDAIAFELIPTEQGIKRQSIVFQFEMVYTNNEGCRMIRIFSFDIPVSNDIRKICSSVDEATLITMMCKRACTSMLFKGPIQTVELLKNEIQGIINQNAFNFSSIYHLMHALLSNATFRSVHPYGVDGRMSQIVMLRSLNITNTLLYLYPRMFSVDTSTILPLTSNSFGQGTVFLFHTVDKVYIWVSSATDHLFFKNAFGCQNLEDLPKTFPPINTKPCKNSTEYKKIQNLISNCNELSRKYLNVEVIGQESPREFVFSDIMVDDSNISGCNLLLWIRSMRFLSQ